MNNQPFKVLALDGGGAKGFYTIGVLKEVEALVKQPLHEHFDLVFGTSTGSIIAGLIAIGKSADEMLELYNEHVVTIMAKRSRKAKSKSLESLAEQVFGDTRFDQLKTRVGIVTTRWEEERPMIFKGDVAQAFGRKGTFQPGFGVRLGEAIQASCAAYPFFEKKFLETSQGRVELVDGGYCANNPALYALTDATGSLKIPRAQIRLLSIGVGQYPLHPFQFRKPTTWVPKVPKLGPAVRFVQKVFEINTTSMDQLRSVMFRDVSTVRIHDAFTQPEMATDMFEHDLQKLNVLWQRGRESFAHREKALSELLG